jgi:hypothetical protein
MIKDLMKIASFLDKTGRTKDANFIDYIAEKYAGGDLSDFFANKMQKDFLKSEYGATNSRKKYALVSAEEVRTNVLLKSLSIALKD